MAKSQVMPRSIRLRNLGTEMVVGATSSLMLIGVEMYFWLFRRAELFDGLRFDSDASADLMQTLELNVLRQDIIRSLWYLHFQPPGFDLVRLVLAAPELLIGSEPSSGSLDFRLYMFSALLFGLMNGIVFFWARKLSRSKWIAFATVTLWSLYPGNIAMVTYLDSMYLSTVLLTLTLHFWLLWYTTSNAKFALVSALAGIGVTLVRTSLQPFMFFVAMLAGLVLLFTQTESKLRGRSLFFFAACTMLLLFLPVKQFSLFGTFTTTSSAGHHLLGMIRYQPTEEELRAVPVPASILRNAKQFENKFNNSQEAIVNYQYSKIFVSQISSNTAESFRESLVSASRSITKGAGATQDFKPNVLVQSLPWAEVSSRIFSGLSYGVFVAAGIISLLIAKRRILTDNAVRLFLAGIPPLIVIASVAFTIIFGSLRYTASVEMGEPFGWTDGFTWTESNRVKFLLEPVFFSSASVGLLMVATRVCLMFVDRVRGSR